MKTKDALKLYLKLDNDRRAGCEISPSDWAECHQAATRALAEVSEIIVIVEGGVVQDIAIPPGCNVRVTVRDYDVDSSDEADLERDANGDLCNVWTEEPTP